MPTKRILIFIIGFILFCQLSPSYSITLQQPIILANIGKIYTPPDLSSPFAIAENNWEELNAEFIDAYRQKKYSEAFTIAKSQLSMAKLYFGSQHPKTAKSLNAMGIIHEAKGQDDIAIIYYTHALRIIKTVYSPTHPEISPILNNLGNIFLRQSNYPKAEEYLVAALQIREKNFGPEHQTIAASAFNLGRFYERVEEFTDAELYYKYAATLWERTLGPMHPNVAKSLNNLANIYVKLGNNSRAEENHFRALEIRGRTLGPDHIEVAESLFNLATIYTKQSKYAAAEPFYLEALIIMEKKLDPTNPKIALTLYSLANVYHIQAKNEENFNRTLVTRIEQLEEGDDEDEIASQLDNRKRNLFLSQFKLRQKQIAEKYAKAEPLYIRAIKIFEATKGNENPSLKIIKKELSMLNQRLITLNTEK